MNPLRPVSNVVDAIVMPFKALFVVGLCAAINAVTYHGHWWFKWVALGMGIATVVALARGAKSLLLMALVAGGGWWIWKRYGDDARRRFDDWAAGTRPEARRVLEVVRGGVH